MERIINLKSIALHNPTEVECEGKKLLTQGLSIHQLVELWKWYYDIAPFDKIVIFTNEKNYNAMQQPPLASAKSVLDIFNELNITVLLE